MLVQQTIVKYKYFMDGRELKVLLKSDYIIRAYLCIPLQLRKGMYYVTWLDLRFSSFL